MTKRISTTQTRIPVEDLKSFFEEDGDTLDSISEALGFGTEEFDTVELQHVVPVFEAGKFKGVDVVMAVTYFTDAEMEEEDIPDSPYSTNVGDTRDVITEPLRTNVQTPTRSGPIRNIDDLARTVGYRG